MTVLVVKLTFGNEHLEHILQHCETLGQNRYIALTLLDVCGRVARPIYSHSPFNNENIE